MDKPTLVRGESGKTKCRRGKYLPFKKHLTDLELARRKKTTKPFHFQRASKELLYQVELLEEDDEPEEEDYPDWDDLFDDDYDYFGYYFENPNYGFDGMLWDWDDQFIPWERRVGYNY